MIELDEIIPTGRRAIADVVCHPDHGPLVYVGTSKRHGTVLLTPEDAEAYADSVKALAQQARAA